MEIEKEEEPNDNLDGEVGENDEGDEEFLPPFQDELSTLYDVEEDNHDRVEDSISKKRDLPSTAKSKAAKKRKSSVKKTKTIKKSTKSKKKSKVAIKSWSE